MGSRRCQGRNTVRFVLVAENPAASPQRCAGALDDGYSVSKIALGVGRFTNSAPAFFSNAGTMKLYRRDYGLVAIAVKSLA
jgi:hypothetical protein